MDRLALPRARRPDPDGTAAAVAAAADAGVTTLITVGCDRATSLAAIAAAAAHEHVYATVGLHPHDAVNGVDTIVDLLDTPASSPSVSAVSTTTTTTHRARRSSGCSPSRSARERTRPAARDPLTRRLGRHVRRPRRRRRAPPHDLPLLHRRSRRGPPRLDIGALLSFSGIVTFKGAPRGPGRGDPVPTGPDAGRDRQPLPRARPPPRQAQPPAWVPHVGQHIADLRDIPWPTSLPRPPRTPAVFALPPDSRHPAAPSSRRPRSGQAPTGNRAATLSGRRSPSARSRRNLPIR
jgi:TatD DNase family protein